MNPVSLAARASCVPKVFLNESREHLQVLDRGIAFRCSKRIRR